MLLDNIKGPEDVKALDPGQLKRLCGELRWKIIKTTSENGGHLASNLGTVELTVALMRVLDMSEDEVIWDVGHQAYSFKLLTGRYKDFHTLRTFGGISGYLKREESPYDIFGAGHSSTSLSAAHGIRIAKRMKGEKGAVIAIIGDGALPSGIALEALNNIGHDNEDILIILNTNEMSISKNTGAISTHLSKLITNPTYNKTVHSLIDKLLEFGSNGGTVVKFLLRSAAILKLMMVPGKLFESLGIRYFGPVDGHDICATENMIRKIKGLRGAKILNVVTKKGLGYFPAFDNPVAYHGVSPFDIESGKSLSVKKSKSCSSVFGDTISSLTEKDNSIIAITAAMGYGTGLADYCKRFPNNFYDVGIEEEHAVTFAAGASVKGIKPFVAIYSTFLQRAYDMMSHDVAIQSLPVRFFLDRGGIVGDDGETHHGVFDLSYLRSIPRMKIIAPSDNTTMQRAVISAYEENSGPIAVRYPRGSLEGELMKFEDLIPLKEGKGRFILGDENAKAAVVSVGRMTALFRPWVEKMRNEGNDISLFDVLWVKPFDESALLGIAKNAKMVITAEDNAIPGGFGEAAASLFSRNDLGVPVRMFGWQDIFPTAGTIDELFDNYQINYETLEKYIREVL